MKIVDKILNSLFLYLSDCDGMCDMYNEQLREVCKNHKEEEIKESAQIGLTISLTGIIIIIIIVLITNN